MIAIMLVLILLMYSKLMSTFATVFFKTFAVPYVEAACPEFKLRSDC